MDNYMHSSYNQDWKTLTCLSKLVDKVNFALVWISNIGSPLEIYHGEITFRLGKKVHLSHSGLVSPAHLFRCTISDKYDLITVIYQTIRHLPIPIKLHNMKNLSLARLVDL